MKIWIRNRQKHTPLDLRKIRRVAQRILTRLGLPDAELSLLLVNDAQIQALNRRYLRLDKPTNVLAFGLGKNYGEIWTIVFGGLRRRLSCSRSWPPVPTQRSDPRCCYSHFEPIRTDSVGYVRRGSCQLESQMKDSIGWLARL